MAWAVPLTEIAVVLLLLFSRTRIPGLVASLFLLLLFTGYIAVMLVGDYDLPCQCGGVVSKLSWPQHLVFNCLFIGINAYALYAEKNQRFQGGTTATIPYA